ncbi:hypothetical protein [Lacticaseibacillus saniviri]|uniref:Uncharacterized protein n=1 Tax=Lacticaseibacillus saniviri JCM 17471 = DSM 24301 TaxID=1293598 RepID=A0A0R2MN67_9LACO|nr:hypothetical protein [Lacticaseibacillus saniviri]KRO15126.1 hypothetical protein IV56_GL000215 [Lacticaseibacillus saniviri JCM 17471 = DSM 24301]MCG4282474.1 hypothetical protein [Lacticaseibacillus saniviri]
MVIELDLIDMCNQGLLYLNVHSQEVIDWTYPLSGQNSIATQFIILCFIGVILMFGLTAFTQIIILDVPQTSLQLVSLLGIASLIVFAPWFNPFHRFVNTFFNWQQSLPWELTGPTLFLTLLLILLSYLTFNHYYPLRA